MSINQVNQEKQVKPSYSLTHVNEWELPVYLDYLD